MIPALIISCEVAFWVFVAAGLLFRYTLGWKRTGSLLLLCTPIVDLVLLIATAKDLHDGATAGITHGLAAIYIGASVVFGHRMIRWADIRYAYWFAGGEAPNKEKLYGAEHAKKERAGWLLHLLAWAIGCGLLLGIHAWVDDPSRTEELLRIIRLWSLVLGIDFVISFSYTVWPRTRKERA
jgi:hypothetical protein